MSLEMSSEKLKNQSPNRNTNSQPGDKQLILRLKTFMVADNVLLLYFSQAPLRFVRDVSGGKRSFFGLKMLAGNCKMPC